MTEAKESVPKILPAMLNIMKGIGVLTHDGQGPSQHQNYPYLTVEKIISHLNPLLIKHKVVVASNVLEEDTRIDFAQAPLEPKQWSGRMATSRTNSTVKIQYTFISVEDGSTHVITGIGSAADTGDKALRKATTTAFKTALMQTFFIASQEVEVDGTDIEEDLEKKATSSQGEKKDRGQQQAEVARNRTPKAKTEEDAPQVEPEEAAEEPKQAPSKPVAAKTAGDDLKSAKAALRDALKERADAGGALTVPEQNELALRVTGLERSAWVSNAGAITKITEAVRAGEVA